MSEEIRIRADIRDLVDREFACEMSSSVTRAAGSQVELARLMGETFRVLSHHLAAPPNDHLILQTFALAALDSELEFPE
jgi:hypothetical protein